MHKTVKLRRLLALAVVAATAIGVTLATPSPALASDHERIQNYQRPTLAAYVDWVSTNLPVVQRAYDGTTHAQWKRLPVNFGRSYQFMNWYSGMCMGVGGTQLRGAPIETRLCNPDDSSQWWTRVQDPVLPIWRIYNTFTGFYISADYCLCWPGVVLTQELYDASDPALMWQMWG